jgi:hypothetical protein
MSQHPSHRCLKGISELYPEAVSAFLVSSESVEYLAPRLLS